jgi:pyruvate/2-oxoglutarate dehydrogenase complex dihydrolipoamide dehydrogenase (E3) component
MSFESDSQTFDIVVIGTGTAASGVASRCRADGWSVAVIDNRPHGGICALLGCDPKKVLQRAAEVVNAARLLHGKGIADPGLAVDWSALMAFVSFEFVHIAARAGAEVVMLDRGDRPLKAFDADLAVCRIWANQCRRSGWSISTRSQPNGSSSPWPTTASASPTSRPPEQAGLSSALPI